VGAPSREGTDEQRVGLSAGHSEEAEGGEDRVATPDADAFQARNCRAQTRRPTGLSRPKLRNRRKRRRKRARPPLEYATRGRAKGAEGGDRGRKGGHRERGGGGDGEGTVMRRGMRG